MDDRDVSTMPVDGVLGLAAVGPTVLSRAGLERIGYADVFTMRVPGAAATPEQWARAMFCDVPTVGERFIWQGLLQLRLVPGRSGSAVAGWQIAARGEDWIRLEARSWDMAVNLIVRATPSEVSLATLIRYDRLPASQVWTVLSAVHRRLAPGLLRAAAAAVVRVDRGSGQVGS